VLDTVDPGAPEIATDEDRKGSDPSPAWRFTGEPGAVLECTLKRGDDVVARMDECASPKDYRLEERGAGTYTFGVRATDAAGNTGELATATYEYERAEAGRKEEPHTEPAPQPAPPAPESAPATSAPAPTSTTGTTASERSERSEQAAKARARKRAAAAAQRRAAAARRAAQAAQAARTAPKPEKQRRKRRKAATEKLAEVGKVMAQAAGVAAEKTAFPVLLLGLCGLFLVAQDRVDRRDPKLALAPIFADPEMPFVAKSELAADEPEQEPEP
jgi:pyruvate/2-oxoglutarate dehydrogenase complex dihydrolipoamide acyltransferase (E2) component